MYICYQRKKEKRNASEQKFGEENENMANSMEQQVLAAKKTRHNKKFVNDVIASSLKYMEA